MAGWVPAGMGAQPPRPPCAGPRGPATGGCAETFVRSSWGRGRQWQLPLGRLLDRAVAGRPATRMHRGLRQGGGGSRCGLSLVRWWRYLAYPRGPPSASPLSPAIGVAACPPARPGTPWRAASPTHETPALGPLGTRRGELAGAQRGASEAAGGGPSVQGEQVRLALSRAAPAEWTWRPTRGPPRGRSRVRTPCAVVPEGSAFGGGRRARTCPCVTLRLSPHGLFMAPAGGGGAGAGGRAAADLWCSWGWSRRLSPRALGTFRSRHLPGRWSGWGHEICFGGEGPERPPHPHWSPLPGGGQECQLQGTEPETSPWPSEGFLGEWPVAGQMWPLGSIDKVRVWPQGLHPEHRKAESVSGSEG